MTAAQKTFNTLRARTSRAWHQQRTTVLLWALPLLLMVVATWQRSPQVGQWALLLGMVALLASVTRLARYVVTRMTQIVALWEEDVPATEGLARLYAMPDARHRGDRAKKDA